jgi:peptidoglycan/LPS O-acetylase OafA/YrhL
MAAIATVAAIWGLDSGQTAEVFDLYRADIDGLRAIAVLLVVFFHAFPSVLGGGFIGVDVFFVISGFLISSIILVETAKSQFSYRTFYARRIRRLLPALVLVLAACVAIGWFVLFPHELALLGENLAAAAAFVSNFVLYRQSGYFAAAAEAQPLLHLWSLGIEEQFYIVWPLLLATLAPRSKSILLVCLVMLAASFALNIYMTKTNAVEAFYFPLTRWWELMAGAALAWCRVFKPVVFRRRSVDGLLPVRAGIAHEMAAVVGLFLILGAAIGLHTTAEFPGWWALMPVAGACLLIASETTWLNRQILASTPFVAIGLISYPLYLWHWPVLAFARASTPPDGFSTSMVVGLVFLSFVLASLTYFCIERPIRFGKRRQYKVALPSIALLVLGASGIAISANAGFPKRIPDELNAIVAGELIPKPYSFHDWRIEVCFIEDSKSDWKFAPECYGNGRHPLVMLWGSSMAASLYPALAGPLAKAGFNLAQFTAVDCSPTVQSVDHDDNQHCIDVNNYVVEKVVPDLRPDVIIMHTVWRREETIKYIRETVEKLRRYGARQIILVGPEVWWEPRDGLPEVYVKYAHEHPNRPLLPQRTTFGLLPDGAMEDLATRKEAASVNVSYVSIWDELCNQQGCLTRIGDSLRQDMITYDRAHLTPRAWGLIIPSIMALLPRESELTGSTPHPGAEGFSLKPTDQRN